MIFPTKRALGLNSPGSIRRFSPDGRLLAIFSPDAHSLHLYQLKHGYARAESFDDFFTLLHTITPKMLSDNALLCRDFLLFTARHIIVASAAPSGDVSGCSLLKNPKSLSSFEQLDDVCFHLIDMHDNYAVCDALLLSKDYILLANHAGVSLLHDSYFLVTSLQHQCVTIYRIIENKFISMTLIGHNPDLSRLHGETSQLTCGLWHKLLVKAFVDCPNKAWFHGASGSLRKLSVSKTQFIDATRVLIRMVPQDFLNQRTSPGEHPIHFIFIVYNIFSHEIEVMAHYSKFLDWILENDHLLRQAANEISGNYSDSYSNCQDTRNSFLKHIETVNGVKKLNILRKLMFSFPYSPQLLSSSIYFSNNCYRYDDKVIGRELKWRQSPDYPIRFIFKDHYTMRERLAFSIEPWADQPFVSTSFKRFHCVCWHPNEPLAIVSHQSALRSTSIDIYYY